MFWAVGDVERDEATKACRVAVVVVKALTDGTNASSAHNNLDVFIVSSLLSARREERSTFVLFRSVASFCLLF